ncbi:hypothetical protein QCA50_005734 [Cerrena zonata]|uniref:Cupredoxin n=1 Tax=Cerrena zonata TaxID=2478898 RepID=A0AAW0GHF5_9APHY
MRASLALAAILGLVSSALATDYNVEVGPNSQLVFDPPFVHAKKGDIVRFHFNPKAHSVTQSSFDTPCTKAGNVFDTDLQPVTPEQAAQGQKPSKEFFVADETKPLWFYCKQVGHCGKGMVFAINPPDTGNTFDAFKARAIQQGNSTAPPPSSTGSILSVDVGPTGQLVFQPPFVQAKKGDIVRFKFHPKAHSVTQSNFNTPCTNANLFDTQLQPVTPDQDAQGQNPTMDFFVGDDSKPLWFYCKQTGHCGKGMVFAINPPASGNTFDAFKALAIQQGGSNTTVTAKLCESVDNNGSPLRAETPDQPQKGLVTCLYDAARTCTYNIADGSFDSGGSICPTAVPGQGGLQQAPAGQFCALSDNVSSALVAENLGSSNVVCQYKGAGVCTYSLSGSKQTGNNECPSALKTNPSSSGSKLVTGALGENDSDSSSNYSTLIRNSYIIIGLLAAVILGLLGVTVSMLVGRRGKGAKYSRVTVPPSFKGFEESESMTHSQRYSDA